MLNYLLETGLYDTESDLYYVKRMLSKEDKTIPVKELVERFIEVDKYFENEPWTIRQILSNIDIIIPLEDRE